MQGKIFNDPVYGCIELDPILVQVIDTPQFQRLRHLKQLGSAYHVFPGASHNRFEHSIGVGYLASLVIHHLNKNQPELQISSSDIKCVCVAGLCHDLGHGPFSHVFDNEFIKQARPDLTWTHEDASEEMLDYLIQDNEIDITPQELKFIKDLIHGAPRSEYPQSHKLYLFDIVANKRNSLDVDKFDYLTRDCYFVGMKSSVDAMRLIQLIRVVENQICFHQKEAFGLYEVFHTRYSLFKRVYTHKVGKAIEYMITDALLKADPVLKISLAVNDMRLYLNLDDSILNEIARSTDPMLEESRSILLRIKKRDLYRCADQIQIPPDLHDSITKDQITAEKIIKYDIPKANQSRLYKNDLIVEWLTLNYAMKDQNPMDSVGFYTKYDPNHVITIPKDQISSFLPNYFIEVTIRVFVRQEKHLVRAQTAFRRFLNTINETLIQEPPTAHGSPHSALELTLPPSVPVLDVKKNPFLSPELKSLEGSPDTLTSRYHSRSVSPCKSVLTPSAAHTLPIKLEEIMEQSPIRKRKRIVFE